jgi:hypothetical protein
MVVLMQLVGPPSTSTGRRGSLPIGKGRCAIRRSQRSLATRLVACSIGERSVIWILCDGLGLRISFSMPRSPMDAQVTALRQRSLVASNC